MKIGLSLVVVLVSIGPALSCGGTAARATKDAAASESDGADAATPPGSGGTVGGTGGAPGSGGRATGGARGSGGAIASGGVVATGGTAGSSSGGTTGTGGGAGAAGAGTGTGTGGSTTTGGGTGISTGGIAATGGMIATGGVAATGGRIATGGITGTSGGAGGGTGTGTGGSSTTGGGTGTGTGGAAGTGGITAAGGTTGTGGRTGTGGTGGGGTTATAGTTSVAWDFPNDTQGWIGSFADYPPGLGTGYDLSYGWAALPAEVGPGGGLRLNGNNHSDDLFMYVMREITGLSPQTTYLLDVVAVIDTNAPADCGGIGGSPGASVYVKIGASSLEPVATLDSLGWLRLNIDKGIQSTSGADMKVVGDLGNTKVCPDLTYEPKTFILCDFRVTSTADGKLWIILGTDSGFEGITTLYYDRIAVTLRANP